LLAEHYGIHTEEESACVRAIAEYDDMHKSVALNGTIWNANVQTAIAYRAWQAILQAGTRVVSVSSFTATDFDVQMGTDVVSFSKQIHAPYCVVHEYECLLKRVLKVLELFPADTPEHRQWIQVEIAHMLTARARTTETEFEKDLFQEVIAALHR
jgi:hypothetical protein